MAERAENKAAVGLGRGRVPIFAPHRIGRDGLPGDGPAFRVDESTGEPDASLQYDPAEVGRGPDIRVLPRLRCTVEVLVRRIGESRLRRLVSTPGRGQSPTTSASGAETGPRRRSDRGNRSLKRGE